MVVEKYNPCCFDCYDFVDSGYYEEKRGVTEFSVAVLNYKSYFFSESL